MVSVRAIKVGDAIPDFELETDASTASNKVTLKSQVPYTLDTLC